MILLTYFGGNLRLEVNEYSRIGTSIDQVLSGATCNQKSCLSLSGLSQTVVQIDNDKMVNTDEMVDNDEMTTVHYCHIKYKHQDILM